MSTFFDLLPMVALRLYELCPECQGGTLDEHVVPTLCPPAPVLGLV